MEINEKILNEAFLEASKAVMISSSFEIASRKIFDACRKATGAASGYVALLSEDGEENEVLFLEAGGMPCNVDPNLPMPIRGLREQAYRNMQVVYDNDFMNSQWVKYMPAKHLVLRNVMFAPLRNNNKVIGIIGLANKPEPFTDKDAIIADAFGDFAAVALRRTKDDEALRENEFYLKKAQEIGKIGHFSFNPDTGLVEGSEELLRIFDIKERPQSFESFAAALHPEDRHLILPFIERAIKDSVPYDVVHRILHRDGTILHVRARGEILNTSRGKRMVGIVQDITETKLAEEEHRKLEHKLNQAQKLDSIGILAGGIAHDFNNLLGGIFGYIGIACENTREEKTAIYLSKAQGTIERARSLTQQLLTFAKGGEPVRKTEHLFPFVQETALFALSGSNISCSFDIPSDLFVCDFDKNQIGQVIDNIIINAQQSMPLGGTINVSAKNIRVSKHYVLKDGDYVKISIKDHGTGIASEHLPFIFDPFFTTKAKGHGLGLSTCYSIVNRHKGVIDIESILGKGSTFNIYLPATKNSNSTTESIITSSHRGCGTFIIMDDEEVLRETIGAMVESFGYMVVSRENGKDTIDFVKNEIRENRKIAAMLFDLTIPGGMGGKEVVGEIRKFDSETPIFVASGYAKDPVMANPKEYGFTASICKPFTKTELACILNAFFNK